MACCYNCSCDVPTRPYPARHCTAMDTIELCEVCSTTYLSHATQFPANCPDPLLYKSVAVLFNRLFTELAEIREKLDAGLP